MAFFGAFLGAFFGFFTGAASAGACESGTNSEHGNNGKGECEFDHSNKRFAQRCRMSTPPGYFFEFFFGGRTLSRTSAVWFGATLRRLRCCHPSMKRNSEPPPGMKTAPWGTGNHGETMGKPKERFSIGNQSPSCGSAMDIARELFPNYEPTKKGDAFARISFGVKKSL